MDWEKGKPKEPGLYWVRVINDGNPEIQMVMIRKGFANSFNFKILYPEKYVTRVVVFRGLNDLVNCKAHSKIDEPVYLEES